MCAPPPCIKLNTSSLKPFTFFAYVILVFIFFLIPLLNTHHFVCVCVCVLRTFKRFLFPFNFVSVIFLMIIFFCVHFIHFVNILNYVKRKNNARCIRCAVFAIAAKPVCACISFYFSLSNYITNFQEFG